MGERKGEKREERREKEVWITLQRAVTRCAVMCCGYFYIYIFMLFEGCDLPQCFSLLHVAVSSTSFTHTFSNTYTYTYIYTHIQIQKHLFIHLHLRVRVCVCFCVLVFVCVYVIVWVCCVGGSGGGGGWVGVVFVVPSAVSLSTAETEQLYQGKRMIGGIGHVLFSTYSLTENG